MDGRYRCLGTRRGRIPPRSRHSPSPSTYRFPTPHHLYCPWFMPPSSRSVGGVLFPIPGICSLNGSLFQSKAGHPSTATVFVRTELELRSMKCLPPSRTDGVVTSDTDSPNAGAVPPAASIDPHVPSPRSPHRQKAQKPHPTSKWGFRKGSIRGKERGRRRL